MSERRGTGKEIGLMNESSIHAELKKRYLRGKARSEQQVGDYVVDILGARKRVVEIQTSGFWKLKRKLGALLETHRVRVVYPLAVEKHLVVYDARCRKVVYRRKSPLRRCILDIAWEVTQIWPLLGSRNLELEVLLTKEEEVRAQDGAGSWRRKGVSIIDRRLVEIVDRKVFREVDDFRVLLPDDCPEDFTNRKLAETMGVPVEKVRRVTYLLKKLGVLRVAGKDGNAHVFKFTRRRCAAGRRRKRTGRRVKKSTAGL